MTPLFSIPFLKLEGCGNSFILLNEHEAPAHSEWSDVARRVCSPAWGLGTDGLMVIGDAQQSVIPVAMFNPDGSRMGMCGNGIRCVVRSLILSTQVPLTQTTFLFEVEGKRYQCEAQNEGRLVTVQMGQPSFDPKVLPLSSAESLIDAALQVEHTGEHLRVTAVSMGNPHCVILEGPFDPTRLGPIIEHHPLFPARTNVEFVEVESRSSLRVAVWERGAGITLACGTGACATVVAFHSTGRCDRKVQVRLPGGTVEVEWDALTNNVILTGPVGEIAMGTLPQELFVTT